MKARQNRSARQASDSRQSSLHGDSLHGSAGRFTTSGPVLHENMAEQNRKDVCQVGRQVRNWLHKTWTLSVVAPDLVCGEDGSPSPRLVEGLVQDLSWNRKVYDELRATVSAGHFGVPMQDPFDFYAKCAVEDNICQLIACTQRLIEGLQLYATNVATVGVLKAAEEYARAVFILPEQITHMSLKVNEESIIVRTVEECNRVLHIGYAGATDWIERSNFVKNIRRYANAVASYNTIQPTLFSSIHGEKYIKSKHSGIHQLPRQHECVICHRESVLTGMLTPDGRRCDCSTEVILKPDNCDALTCAQNATDKIQRTILMIDAEFNESCCDVHRDILARKLEFIALPTLGEKDKTRVA